MLQWYNCPYSIHSVGTTHCPESTPWLLLFWRATESLLIARETRMAKRLVTSFSLFTSIKYSKAKIQWESSSDRGPFLLHFTPELSAWGHLLSSTFLDPPLTSSNTWQSSLWKMSDWWLTQLHCISFSVVFNSFDSFWRQIPSPAQPSKLTHGLFYNITERGTYCTSSPRSLGFSNSLDSGNPLQNL